MESEQLVKLIINVTAIVTFGALIWKIIIEYFKDKKNQLVRNIQELVNEAMDLRFRGLDDKLNHISREIQEVNKNREDDRKEFNRNLIEVFKEFK